MNNEDLEAIEKEITERKAQAVTVSSGETHTVPVIPFEDIAEKRTCQTVQDTTQDLVESAFNQAVINRVATDENVQRNLLNSAEKVIKNKTDAIK